MNEKMKRLEVVARECILEGFDDIAEGVNAHAILAIFEEARRLRKEADDLREIIEDQQEALESLGVG